MMECNETAGLFFCEQAFRVAFAYQLLKGEVRRGAASVLAGEQAVGEQVGAGWAPGGGHEAIVLQRLEVCRVRGGRLGRGGVGAAQHGCRPPVQGLVRPASEMSVIKNAAQCISDCFKGPEEMTSGIRKY